MWQEYLEGLRLLDHAVYALSQKFINETEPTKENRTLPTLARCAVRGCGIIQDLYDNPTEEKVMLARKKVYQTFGAPGDFGYNTPIGAALKKIYNG